MVVVADISSRYTELSIRYFERAEQTTNPQLKAKLRKLAEEHRDQALELLDRAVGSAGVDGQSFSSSRRDSTLRRAALN
jgi:hypothetical protein